MNNMKVLYIGHYREDSGWGNWGCEQIRALDSVGVEVVARPVHLSKSHSAIPDVVKECEKRSSKGATHCIQHVLPHYMDFSNKFEKNVGMFCVETSNVLHTGWPIRFEQMDEIWMPDRHSLNAVRESKIKTTAKVIPIPTDITKYQQKLGKLDLGIPEGTFIFYFIGEFHRRKNILALLKAFHTEFSRNEPVALVLKTNGDIKAINEMCNKIKNGLKMYPSIHNYHQETIINHRLSDEDILKLHETGDCFVMPSYGETWAIPAFDAMAKGNVVVSTQVGGMQDYLQNCGRLVGGREEPVFALFETFQDVGTSFENWTSVDINLLRKAMRGAYKDKDEDTTKRRIRKGIEKSYEYSYEAIGARMLKELKNE